MKEICFAAVVAVGLGSVAQADEMHAVQGLFCNTRTQIDSAMGHMLDGVGPRQAAELENGDSVACVYADRVKYVVTLPFIVGESFLTVPVTTYEATLIGVLVGDRLRPVVPPVTIFFVTDKRLEGALAKSGI